MYSVLTYRLSLSPSSLTVSCTWSDSRGLAGGGNAMARWHKVELVWRQSQNSQLLHGLQRLELFNEIRSESDTELIMTDAWVQCQLIPINLSSRADKWGQWWAWRLEWELQQALQSWKRDLCTSVRLSVNYQFSFRQHSRDKSVIEMSPFTKVISNTEVYIFSKCYVLLGYFLNISTKFKYTSVVIKPSEVLKV